MTIWTYGLSAMAEDAVDHARQRITLAMTEEPPGLNSMKATDQVSFFILNHIGEGLVRYGEGNRLEPGVAESWHLDEQSAVFHLRPTARWSDGRPVTAHDFVFAWRMVVAPETASEYAFFLYPVRNAREINIGQQPVSNLGVVALDDHTLRVILARPCSYFLRLTAFGTYFPVREDFFRSRGERYAADVSDLLANGPFRLTRWVHGASLRLERNELYWGREQVNLREIDIPFITSNPATLFNLFRDGKIAMAGLDAETLQEALRRRFHLRRFADGSVFFLEFNFRPDRVTRNLNLRKAMQLVFDSSELVNKVIGLPGTLPTPSLFPTWLKGVKQTFREEFPVPEMHRDTHLAREHLAMARKELGVTAIPPLVFLTGDSDSSAKEAEYFQYLFKRELGLHLRIDRQTFKQRLARMSAGQFDITSAAWGPDFDDPITFGDLFASWNQNNRGRYVSAVLDRWVDVARDELDPALRMQAFAGIQEQLIRDVVILPEFERSLVYVQNPRLKGVVRRIFGADPDYTHARVVP
ncbi:MAG: peptide ABC transporter substrate-binding protein [Magnetococcales bacterium]|nr:peptide ABC transporter substrate-binding protein [Magnetococcales bacterium]MBF0321634.1 peptide ABC transporter substrate-binding protein [Magnetococcales bacterium]